MNLKVSMLDSIIYTTRGFLKTVNWDLKGAQIWNVTMSSYTSRFAQILAQMVKFMQSHRDIIHYRDQSIPILLSHGLLKVQFRGFQKYINTNCELQSLINKCSLIW